MRVSALGLALLAVSACTGHPPQRSTASPGIVFPTTLAEGSGDPDESPPSEGDPPKPRAQAKAEPPPPRGSLPDPEPLRLSEQWEYELEWNAGAVRVLTTSPRKFPQPVVTPRKMGRFAIELWIGAELVERVRFDFPLLALNDTADEPGRLTAPPSLERGARVRQRVLVPAAPRARRAVLVDRASSEITALPWPPEASAATKESK